MLTTRYKRVVDGALAPLAQILSRIGVSPSAITLSCPVLASVICAIFLRTRSVLPFCAAILTVGCLDALDGAVARVSGRVTKFGAYLDAITDRYVEVIVVASVAQVTGYWALSMVVLTGSLLVSYAKARAAMEVAVSNQEWPDLMERTERGVIFVAGLAAGHLIRWAPWGHDLFWWTLAGLSVLIHATVIQRVRRARRLILERSRG